ncbi:IS1634 family transposase, partial [Galbitalea sp. SE-J8]|uniref:IS1634 family transposase n=1 Tax=Galbitalea sp. SE-J8 TaxID=3054952 RepID=UPI00259CAB0A
TIVEHLGSAHDEVELAALVAAARAKITAGQVAFGLDVLTPPGAERVTVEPVVVGSRSRVLWDVLASAYRRLRFEAVDDRVFEYLVLARLVEPTSKADTIRVFAEMGVPDAPSLPTIYRTLKRSITADWRGMIATAAYAHAARHGPLTLVLYDVTRLYFEAEYEDKLRKAGMSKERRVDPQITVGLLVDAGGFPLEIHAFEGNKGETTTLIPVLDAFRGRHKVTDVVVVADAGMLSAANLTAVEDAGLSFIVGSRVSNAPYDLADQLANRGNFFTDGQTIEASRRMGTGKEARDRRVVWQYSAARECRDNRTLNLQIERAQEVADGKRPIKKDRFVTFTGDKPGI